MASANCEEDTSSDESEEQKEEPKVEEVELSDLDKNFNKAIDHVRMISYDLGQEQQLELYGLYKQSTEGECNIPRPGWFDGKGRRKWDAWVARCDLTQDEAKEKYIELLQDYDPEFMLDTESKETWAAVSSLKRPQEPKQNVDMMSVLELARDNYSIRLEKMLEENPELAHHKDEAGLTILHWAADRDAIDALVAGIEGGCELDATDNEGQTALHYAVFCGQAEATRILLIAGASRDVKDAAGNTPKDLADNEDIEELFELTPEELNQF